MRILSFILVLISLAWEGAAQGLALVEDGRPQATIVLAEGASQTLRQAATALQDYVERVSGARLPVVSDAESPKGGRILIGESRSTAGFKEDLSEDRLGYDGCLVRLKGKELLFLGPRDAGAANGVYWFLDWKLGVHILGFGEDAVVAPKQATIELAPFEYVHKPSFAWRESWTSVVRGEKGYIRVLDPEEDERAGAYYALNRRGGVSLSGAHSLYRYVPDSLFVSHPEYFPVIGGERQHEEVQVRLSAPGVLRLVVDKLRAQYPPEAVAYATVSPNDNDGWSEDPEDVAMAEDPAARMLLFCNRVVAELEKTHPRLGVCFLAYSYSRTMEPPLGLKAHPRVAPLVAPLGVCPVHELEHHGECPDQAEMRRIYAGWKQVAEKVTNYPYIYANILPLPVPAAVAREIQYYHRLGLFGVQREHMARGFGWELSYWLEWQLLWDAEQDVEMLRRVFFDGYYGAAAGAMQKVYERLEQAVMAAPVGGKMEEQDRTRYWRGWFQGWTDCFNQLMPIVEGAVEASQGDLEQAVALADSPAARAHVEKDRVALQAALLYARGRQAFDRWDRSRGEADRESALRAVDEALAGLAPFDPANNRGVHAQAGQLAKLRAALAETGE